MLDVVAFHLRHIGFVLSHDTATLLIWGVLHFLFPESFLEYHYTLSDGKHKIIIIIIDTSMYIPGTSIYIRWSPHIPLQSSVVWYTGCNNNLDRERKKPTYTPYTAPAHQATAISIAAAPTPTRTAPAQHQHSTSTAPAHSINQQHQHQHQQ